MLEEKDLQAIAEIMDSKIGASEKRMAQLMAQQRRDIMQDVKTLLDTEVQTKFNLLAEGQEEILRRMPSEDDMDIIDGRLDTLEAIARKHSREIEELKKALAVKHLVQTEKEILQREVDTLRGKLTRLEAGYTAHRKQSHEEKEELEKQLKKMKRIMAGYQEFLRLPEIRPLHIEFVERKRTEQLQRQQEEERQRQEQEARDRERRQARSARGMRMR